MSLKERSFWLDTVVMRGAEGSLPLSERADVAVIGAGYTGLSAARALAKHGAKVVVLEGQTAGWGASSRNGGMVLTGLKLSPRQLLGKYGRAVAQRMYRASLSSINCLKQIVEEEAIDCHFSRCGHLEVACKPSHFRSFVESAQLIAREFNHSVRIVPKEELGSEIGSEVYHGGLVDETSAGLNPAQYVAGLARAAAQAGAVLCDRTRVEGVEPETKQAAKSYRVRTSRGTLWARDILVATGGYTGGAIPALQRKIIPIGSYIIVTEPLPEDLARGVSPRNRMMYDSKNYLHYFRLTPDRRMLFGGRAAFFPETADSIRASAQILRRGMVKVYPQLCEIKVEYAWGGTLDFAFDLMPHAGQLAGLYYALGYAGHGVAMATYLGTKMAEVMCGKLDENPFNALPFPRAPLGLYNGRPWFLPLAGAWYKFLDWVS
jgi:glycine/D-amino acid oxidase-like deaminating enzyme